MKQIIFDTFFSFPVTLVNGVAGVTGATESAGVTYMTVSNIRWNEVGKEVGR